MERSQTELQTSYDCVAAEYTRRFYDELDRKPFDCKMLDWFIEKMNGVGTGGQSCGMSRQALPERVIQRSPLKTSRKRCSRCGVSSVIKVKYGATNAHSSSLTSVGYAFLSILPL